MPLLSIKGSNGLHVGHNSMLHRPLKLISLWYDYTGYPYDSACRLCILEQHTAQQVSSAGLSKTKPGWYLVGAIVILHVDEAEASALAVDRVAHYAGKCHIAVPLKFPLHFLQGREPQDLQSPKQQVEGQL